MPIDKNVITKEMIAKAMQCETAEELMELAKAQGFAITKEEAEAYLAELEDQELDSTHLRMVAGGSCDDGPYVECFTDCITHCVNRHT